MKKLALLLFILGFSCFNGIAFAYEFCGQRDGCGRYQWYDYTPPLIEDYTPPPVNVPSPEEIANRRAVELNDLGVAADKQGDLREAIRLYELALAAGPNAALANTRRNLGVAYNNLGVELSYKGDWEGALYWLELGQQYNSSQQNADNIARARTAIEDIARRAEHLRALDLTLAELRRADEMKAAEQQRAAEIAAQEAAQKEAQRQADLAAEQQRISELIANLRDDLAKQASNANSTPPISGLDVKDGTKTVPGVDGNGPCPPSQDASVVDLCFPETETGAISGHFSSDVELGPDDKKVIGSMIALVHKEGWSQKELDRLNVALRNLPLERDLDLAQTQQVWNDMEARGPASAPAQDAVGGEGPVLYRPGQRQQSHEDCAIYALASAADLPYGIVAARAGELLRQAEWRGAAERNNPQKTMETQGLIVGEIAILAEAFGQAEIIPPSDFSRILKEGRPVIIGVGSGGGRGHEAVLSKTFEHKGETWYEMMDSNQEDPLRRLYLSAAELDGILLDNGLAFRPEPGRTPKLLK